MFLELHFRFDTGKGAVEVSDRSKRLAAYARQTIQNQPQADEAMLRRNKILDEGYQRLLEGLRAELQTQIEELKEEPGFSNSVFSHFSDGEGRIQRTDNADAKVLIKFDNSKRIVSFKSDHPIKFGYYIEVELTNAGTGFYYKAGNKKTELSATNEAVVPDIVGKCLYAIFNVNSF